MYKILFVCTAFAPKNVIGSIRPSKMAKYFIRDGHEVTVITPPMPEGEMKDPMLAGHEMDRVRRVHVPYAGLYRAVRKQYLQSDARGAVPKTAGGSGTVKEFLRFAFLTLSDFFWARAAAKALRKACPGERFDLIISSYPNLGTHWAAGRLKKAGARSFWVADFRDPVVYEWQSGPQQWLNRRFQQAVEQSADAVSVVSKGVMAKFSRSAKKGSLHWVPNGYDPDDMAALSETGAGEQPLPGGNKQLVLSYAGGLYGGKRDLSALFEALRSLVDSGAIKMEDVLILYAGKDEGVLRAQAAPFGLEERVSSLGFVDRKAALSMQRHSDAVLVCSHNSKTDQGIMTGKAYESLMLGRPVITLVNGDLAGSELGDMMRAVNAGLVYEEATHSRDYEALREYLLKLYAQKAGSGAAEQRMNEDIKLSYGYERISGRLLSLLRDALAKEA